MKLKKLFVSLAASVLAVSAYAALNTTTTTASTPNLTLANNWQERMYTNVSGGYIQSRDVDGGGAHIALGYETAKTVYGTHNFEFEIGALFETGSNSKNSISPGGTDVTTNLKVDFDQFPIMANYRFVGNFGNAFSKVTWYAGAGIGVNIIKYKNKYSYLLVNGTETQSNGFTQTKTEGEFAAQGFAGIGYAITENIDFNVGARALGTTRYIFSPENTLPAGNTVKDDFKPYLPNQIRTNQIHWMVEAGLTLKF